MAQTQLTVPVRVGYNFGVGADLLSGAPMNQPVKNDIINSVADAEGSSVNFVIQRIQTTRDLEQTLGISAEASYGSPRSVPELCRYRNERRYGGRFVGARNFRES